MVTNGPTKLRKAAHRIHQGLSAIAAAMRPDRAAAESHLADEWLSPTLRNLFDGMSPHDRGHALRVAGQVLKDGGPTPSADLMVASLLHDVGKGGTPEVRGRVRLPDRTAKVLLARLAPRALDALTRQPTLPGLYLAVHHPRLGAHLVRAAGGTDRTCWLVAAHEDEGSDDEDLRRLMAADAASV